MRSHDTSPIDAGDRSRYAAPAPSTRPTAEALARQVAETVPGGATGRLLQALLGCATDASYEASVRGGGGAVTAGRMMIERASRDILDSIATALAVRLPASASRWLDAAGREDVPLIAGWDLRGGGERRCVKLYVNASDASQESRLRLCAALIPEAALAADAPAVLGMNARADGAVETKLYVQAAEAPELAKDLDARAYDLAAAAREENADAGGVLSFDVVGNELQPRAFFIALREPRNDTDWRCVRSLPGYDPHVVESLLPFPPAPPRSLGIALSSLPPSHLAPRPSPLVWTLYFKPRDSGRAPEALEPVAIFRGGDVEVGMFVEPTEQAVRAFRRTERHAVSVRVRDGKPAAGALEPLVDWFTACLRASERGQTGLAAHLGDPPAPWRMVEATRQRS